MYVRSMAGLSMEARDRLLPAPTWEKTALYQNQPVPVSSALRLNSQHSCIISPPLGLVLPRSSWAEVLTSCLLFHAAPLRPAPEWDTCPSPTSCSCAFRSAGEPGCHR
ncbi:hypothetical protein AAFF_G00091990 [Aldrovandia affinis]|uniref:Uncharacterized protein n=1 Tax=Aldrovandia affinis TaxID=143900 RepID=A0AAD7WY38_9TELE|nr:hypothetical protein AAFF_G00091990 [Aldrovandia affinis]